MKNDGCQYCDGNCNGQCKNEGSGSCSCADFVQGNGDNSSQDLH